MSRAKDFFPFLEWLAQYKKSDFKSDLLAGLTVAIMLIPQGMAYALLAGLPPIYGLYAGIVPLLIYAFFGTSRQLSVGPTALMSLLVMAGIGQFAAVGSSEFIALAVIAALIAGIIQILLGVFRLGFLVNFLSHPVTTGFTSAAAFIIAISQLGNLLGLDLIRSNKVHYILLQAVEQVQNTNWLTFIIGVGGILLMMITKRIHKKLPHALIVVVISTLLVWGFRLDLQGVATAGEVPAGLPAFMIPKFSMQTFIDLLPVAFAISLISFIESMAIAKTIASKHKSYRVIPDQELIALGISKVGGAFFQSFPTTGSFTRSAINDEAGAKTGISSIFSAILIAIILLFLTPLFFYLPKATLAAIIVMAVGGLIDLREAKYLWQNDRKDFLTLLVTFIITLAVGIQQGVLAGVILSVAQIIYQNSKPNFAVLGKLPGSNYFRNIERFPNASSPSNALIFRFDSQLYFGNAEYFRAQIEQLVDQHSPKLQCLIIDASSITDIDSSGVHILKDIIDLLHTRSIRFCFADAIGPVRDILYKTGLMELIGSQNHFMHVSDAIDDFEGKRHELIKARTEQAIQQDVE